MTDALFGGRAFAAFLFDMDGTLLLSTESAERVWSAWARRHGIDVERFLATIHGVRAIDTIRRQGFQGEDAERELRWITQAEIEDAGGVRAIPGAAPFLASLPAERWAIVTSAPRELAVARLAAADLTPSATVVSAEDVARGKPDPECYRLAAHRLGVAPETCLVFEDAPAGIGAAEAAGASVVVITAGHASPVDHPHPALSGFEHLATTAMPDGIRLCRSR